MATKQRELDRVRLEKHVQKGQYEAQVNNLVSSLDTTSRSCLTVRWHTRASPLAAPQTTPVSGATLHTPVSTRVDHQKEVAYAMPFHGPSVSC